MTEEQLRALYAGVLARRAGPDRANCIPPEDLQALVDRVAPEAHRLRILDHVMSCGSCREEFELVRSVAQARPRPGTVPRVFGLAAILALAVSATLLWKASMGPRGPDLPRGGGDSVGLVYPVGEVAAATPLRFVWHAVPDVLRYNFELLAENGELLFSQSTADTSLSLPTRVSLQPGNSFRWWVLATRQDGSQVRATPQPFHLITP